MGSVIGKDMAFPAISCRNSGRCGCELSRCRNVRNGCISLLLFSILIKFSLLRLSKPGPILREKQTTSPSPFWDRLIRLVV
jgi:hypothetical protein